MTLEIAGFAGICLFVIAANLEQRRRDGLMSPALSRTPRSSVEQIWRFIGALCRRLDLKNCAKFEPDNLVHRSAALLMILYAALVITQLTRSSAASGIGFFAVDPLAGALRLSTSFIVYLALALFGVGWLTRRSLPAAIERLSLTAPNWRDWLEGLALAIALFALAQAGVALWARSASATVFDMQTLAARQMFEAVNAFLPAGILLALASAAGEEILVRGALQPVFGIVISSLFFVLLHSQYLFTPAMLILFLVSLGFGWLKHRRGVSASIICHAAYNLLPFLIHRLAM